METYCEGRKLKYKLVAWRFMGSSEWSYKSPNIAYNDSYRTYNPTHNYPCTPQVGLVMTWGYNSCSGSKAR